jgi:hypothetical protein
VGRYYKLQSGTDSVIVEVTAYTSDTVVTVTPYNRAVPASLRATATAVWALCATTLSGLDHLEGETVSILADGNVKPTQAVASGAITISEPAARVTVGLGYTCNLETMEIELRAEGGTLQDRLRNAVSVTVRLNESRALWAGPDADNLDEVAFREDEDYGEPTSLYTGDKEVHIEPTDGTTGKVYLRVEAPVPSTILSIIPKMEFGDD